MKTSRTSPGATIETRPGPKKGEEKKRGKKREDTRPAVGKISALAPRETGSPPSRHDDGPTQRAIAVERVHARVHRRTHHQPRTTNSTETHGDQKTTEATETINLHRARETPALGRGRKKGKKLIPLPSPPTQREIQSKRGASRAKNHSFPGLKGSLAGNRISISGKSSYQGDTVVKE